MLREVRQGRVWSAKPATVVWDRRDLVALWLAPGTQWKRPRRAGGGPVDIEAAVQNHWVLADTVWHGGGAIILQNPADSHALIGFWDERHEALTAWYINLQEPLRRTSLGFDTLDHILDIVISPDRRSWSWKDEDRLGEAVSRGLVAPIEASAIRAEGERALQLLLAGQPPFAPGWHQWRPNPTWTIPTLPPDWEVVNGGAAPSQGAQ